MRLSSLPEPTTTAEVMQLLAECARDNPWPENEAFEERLRSMAIDIVPVIIRKVWRYADSVHMTESEMYVWLAYSALLSLEKSQEQLSELYATMPPKPVMVSGLRRDEWTAPDDSGTGQLAGGNRKRP